MNWKRIKDFASHVAPEWEEMCSNEYPEKAQCPHCGDTTETDVEICGTCEKSIDWESYFEKDYDNE